jgi:RNA polymerase sigma-70 factor (ECF subfamily)
VEDWSLVRAHLGGDGDAFRTLYEKYRDKVYATAFRVVGRPEEAADLTQEIFVKAHGELRSFRFHSKFSTWLFRVSVNHAINRANERERHARIRGRIARDEGGTVRSRAVPFLPKFDERVQGAVETLSPKLRAIIALRYLEGLSYDEIAEVLEVSIGTVKSRLFLAHETLRPVLAAAEKEI